MSLLHPGAPATLSLEFAKLGGKAGLTLLYNHGIKVEGQAEEASMTTGPGGTLGIVLDFRGAEDCGVSWYKNGVRVEDLAGAIAKRDLHDGAFPVVQCTNTSAAAVKCNLSLNVGAAPFQCPVSVDGVQAGSLMQATGLLAAQHRVQEVAAESPSLGQQGRLILAQLERFAVQACARACGCLTPNPDLYQSKRTMTYPYPALLRNPAAS